MCEANYCKGNRKTILYRVKWYYENNKETLQEQTRKKYRKLYEDEKNTKGEYGRNRYYNIS